MNPISRRDLIALGAARSLAAAPPRKRIALIVTEYRPLAHADVIGGRLLGGYEYYGKFQEPRLETAALYTDQVPANDMSRSMAARHHVPIHPTVKDAVTLGTGKLAVDGVVIIGEHGNYPLNEKGQKLYPRFELMSQVVEVFRSSGRAVPVFTDKHLSVDWWKAKQMYDWSRELKFPLLAGSSVPVTWRRPELEFPAGTPLEYAVAAAGGPLEAYGFHALEGLQCMAERRKGGETGVRSVQARQGADVWSWMDANPWSVPLVEAACARSATRKAGNMREQVKSPVLFLAEYRDGFVGATFMLNGHINDFNFAAKVKGRAEPASTFFFLEREGHNHFSTLTHYIEELILNGRAPYPVERTLLTTGILAAAMESAWRKQARIDTPHLDVRYRAVPESLYNRGPVPAVSH